MFTPSTTKENKNHTKKRKPPAWATVSTPR